MVCPFKNVTQFEPQKFYTDWALLQARSKVWEGRGKSNSSLTAAGALQGKGGA
jgi:hypothetical protein